MGFSASSVGFVGLEKRGKALPEVEAHPLSRIGPQMTVMIVITVMRARIPHT